MKNKLLTALILIFFISACKKDEETIDNSPIPQKGCFISTVVSGTDKTVYTYDADNRVIKVEYFDSNTLEEYTTFTYTNTNVTIKNFEANGTADGQQVADMQNGRVVKVVDNDTYSSGGFNYTYSDTEIFEYNSVGFLIKRTGESKTTTNKPNTPATSSTETETYTYQNDNLTQSVNNYISSTSNSTSTNNYEYYTDKDNIINVGYELGDGSNVFLTGKQSKNLVKKISYTSKDVRSGVTSNYSGVSNYTYIFDSNGKPNKATEAYSYTNNGQTSNSTFVYNLTLNCK